MKNILTGEVADYIFADELRYDYHVETFTREALFIGLSNLIDELEAS